MPHLSELAAKYKDEVTFLALSDETEAVVMEVRKDQRSALSVRRGRMARECPNPDDN